jgi:Tfp pilus assembly protein PilX
MSAIVVLDLVLLVVVVVVILGQIGFRRVGRTCRTAAFIPAQRNGERAEAALAENVLAGRVQGAAYQQRMAEIAAADDLRHPLKVPQD